jgi:Cytochrome c554 and c-prime
MPADRFERMSISPIAFGVAVTLFSALCGAVLPYEDESGIGPGPAWRGPIKPAGQNAAFATADGCSMCHSHSPDAIAMTTATGDDVSPYSLWQATLMANSFRDPYWRAQVAKEVEADPESKAAIEGLCLKCHAPMAHHTAILGGTKSPSIADAALDPLARDGVSCTVCHQAKPTRFGAESGFSGNLDIGLERTIFGPYADPATGPMRMHSGFTPTHGAHIRDSALCGSCHTLRTHHQGAAFPEQTPYLEWRNSIYSNEAEETTESRSCQECHMPRVGSMRIARNPAGRDFNIAVRDDFAAHTFVGGNAFMIDLLRENREELGVTASNAALERAARATRQQLSDATARLSISPPRREGAKFRFDVSVENLTGHKFPTGYPARRAWLEVEVRVGREVIFHSGAFDESGRLVGIADERRIPHVDLIERADQVVVYETVPLDPAGEPTTYLTRMASRGKDNRLLPRGYRADGPHAEDTAPLGTESDADFAAGGDIVHFAIDLPEATPKLQVVAWLRYQPIPPAWVDPLRSVDAEEARSFVAMYDAAPKAPETARLTARSEE